MTCWRFPDTCTILRRQATDEIGGVAADEYDVYKEDEPCDFDEAPGKSELQDDAGRDIVHDSMIRIKEEVLITDMILMNGFQYKPLLVLPLRSSITRIIQYYRIPLQRHREVTDAAQQREPIIK